MLFSPTESKQRVAELFPRPSHLLGNCCFAFEIHDPANLAIRLAGEVQKQERSQGRRHALESLLKQVEIVQTLGRRRRLRTDFAPIRRGDKHRLTLPASAQIAALVERDPAQPAFEFFWRFAAKLRAL